MKRLLLLGLGHLCVILAVIGFILPGMPGFVFLLIATWAYSRSSERFHQMILNHPKFGPAIIKWQTHGVISKSGKICISAFMAVSLIAIILHAHSWVWPTLSALCMSGVLAFLLSRPSEAPKIAIENSSQH